MGASCANKEASENNSMANEVRMNFMLNSVLVNF